MKQNMNPAVAAVCILVVLGVLVVFGMRIFSTPTPTATKEEAPKTGQLINGHPVPPGVPSDYMQQENKAGQPK